jgi:drug/metabolite transporter (DMT)-like permease
MVLQIASLVGAALILTAYALIQRGKMKTTSPLYNWMNLVGALLLLCVAYADRRVGFIVLEGAWAALAIPGVLGMRAGTRAVENQARTDA